MQAEPRVNEAPATAPSWWPRSVLCSAATKDTPSPVTHQQSCRLCWKNPNMNNRRIKQSEDSKFTFPQGVSIAHTHTHTPWPTLENGGYLFSLVSKLSSLHNRRSSSLARRKVCVLCYSLVLPGLLRGSLTAKTLQMRSEQRLRSPTKAECSIQEKHSSDFRTLCG